MPTIHNASPIPAARKRRRILFALAYARETLSTNDRNDDFYRGLAIQRIAEAISLVEPDLLKMTAQLRQAQDEEARAIARKMNRTLTPNGKDGNDNG